MIIKIKNLKINASIGIYDWEKNSAREIIINVEMGVNDESSTITGNILDTVDYDAITVEIKKIVNSKHFSLIEELAKAILDLITQNNKVLKCKVEIDKLNAVEGVESFSVILEQAK